MDRIVVTAAPVDRVLALSASKRKRIAKKYSRALIMRPPDLRDVGKALTTIQGVARHVEITERCERQVARYLRRSGKRIIVYPRLKVEAMLRAGTWPPRA